MAIQAEVGLLVSYRGALELDYSIQVSGRESPCPSGAKSYMAACPVVLLPSSNYDLNTCWGYMRADPEQSCLYAGCMVHPLLQTCRLAYHQRVALRSCASDGVLGSRSTANPHHIREFDIYIYIYIYMDI